VHGPRLAIPAASAIATEVAIVSNFLLNDRWTFRSGAQPGSAARRLLRFNGVALGGMLITAVMLTLLTASTRLPLLIGNLLAVGAATIWNYAINSRWTWSSAPSAPEQDQPTTKIQRAQRPANTHHLPILGDLCAFVVGPQSETCTSPHDLGLLWSGEGRLLTEQDEDSLL
jgi:putative flippase GtrA